eukprot:Opistho-2@77001
MQFINCSKKNMRILSGILLAIEATYPAPRSFIHCISSISLHLLVACHCVQHCAGLVFAAVDCQYSAWSDWSSCSTACGFGVSTRVRVIAIQAANGGALCTGPSVEEKECVGSTCAIDCEFSAWSEWSACSAACGQGVKIRTRHITVQAQFGGALCSGSSFDST